MSADQTELEFGDYGHSMSVSAVKKSSGGGGESTYEFEHSGTIGDDKERLLADGEDSPARGEAHSWWSFQFYQQYFDVDTDQFLERLINGALPRGRNLIISQLRPIPDLYGPFWISTTLIFAMAVCGNFAAYLQSGGGPSDLHWDYDFGMVTGSATAIFAYLIIIPAAIVGWTWYRRLDGGYSYLEILSAYGYSLGLFVPVSILWMIPMEGLRWTLMIAAVAASGAVLAATFWPLFRGDSNKAAALGALIFILGLHCLLAVSCKELFFASGSPAQLNPSTNALEEPNISSIELPSTDSLTATVSKEAKMRRSPEVVEESPDVIKKIEEREKGTLAGITVSTSPKLTGG